MDLTNTGINTHSHNTFHVASSPFNYFGEMSKSNVRKCERVFESVLWNNLKLKLAKICMYIHFKKNYFWNWEKYLLRKTVYYIKSKYNLYVRYFILKFGSHVTSILVLCKEIFFLPILYGYNSRNLCPIYLTSFSTK